MSNRQNVSQSFKPHPVQVPECEVSEFSAAAGDGGSYPRVKGSQYSVLPRHVKISS